MPDVSLYSDVHMHGHHVRFKIEKYNGDFYVMARRDHVPIKKMLPFDYLDESDDFHNITLCDVSVSHATYLGFHGGHACSVYDVEAEVFQGDCMPSPPYHAEQDEKGVTEMTESHVHVGQCVPWQYVDFNLPTSAVKGKNIVFEVLLGGESSRNPNALEVLVFDNGITSNRKSELRSTTAIDGVYSLAFDSGHSEILTNANIFLSVRCQSEAVRFKAMALTASPVLHLVEAHSGEVCPGGWFYFSYMPPDDVQETDHLRFNITKHEGEAYFMVRSEEHPTRLIHPYIDMKEHVHDMQLDFCGLEAGVVVYLGVRGGKKCASFEVEVTKFSNSDEEASSAKCDAERGHATEKNRLYKTQKLVTNVFEYGSCKTGSWSTTEFTFEIDEAHMGNNLIVEVEQFLDDRLDPGALEVYGFYDKIPTNNKEAQATFRSTQAVSNMHSLSVDYRMVRYGESRNYAFGVKCGVNAAARFKINRSYHLRRAPVAPPHARRGLPWRVGLPLCEPEPLLLQRELLARHSRPWQHG